MSSTSIQDWFLQIQQSFPGSLNTTRHLCSLLANPQNSFKSIHIAGTNGKGSVTTKLARVLQGSGYKVGIFTSPHIFNFTERIQVDFNPIQLETFYEYLNQVKLISSEHNLALGWFDIYTIISFLYFRDSNIDFACIEVGLGGLLDNTNVLFPILSIIVSIGFDHVSILGNTLEEITFNKAGIIKPGVPLVYGWSVVESIVLETCERQGSRAFRVEKSQNYQTYDMENQEICKFALGVLQEMNYFDRDIKLEFLVCRPQFRLQEFLVMGKKVVLDVSHNYDGIKRLVSDLGFMYNDTKIDTVFAVMRGKEFKESLGLLRRSSENLFVCSGSSNKLMLPEEILDDNQVAVDEKGPIQLILPSILKSNSSNIVLITGTFYIMPDAWSIISSYI